MTATTEETSTNPYATDKFGGIDLSNYPDSTVSKLWAKVQEQEPKAWQLHEDLQKFSPPTLPEIDSIIAESDVPNVVALREKIDAAEAALAAAREEARNYVREGIETLPAEDLETVKASFTTTVSAIRNLVGLVRDLSGTLGYEDVSGYLDVYKIPTLKGITTTAKKDGADQPRPQVSKIELARADGTVWKTLADDKAKLSYAAIAMKVKTDDIYGPWMKAAGAEKWQDVKNVLTFNVADYKVTITPKA